MHFRQIKHFSTFLKASEGSRKGLIPNIGLTQGQRHQNDLMGHALPPPPPPTFLCSKKKKGRQRGKRKGFKAETIKSLIILERLEYAKFSCRKTMVADNTFQCSIPPRSHPPQFKINFASHVTDKTNLKKI